MRRLGNMFVSGVSLCLLLCNDDRYLVASDTVGPGISVSPQNTWWFLKTGVAWLSRVQPQLFFKKLLWLWRLLATFQMSLSLSRGLFFKVAGKLVSYLFWLCIFRDAIPDTQIAYWSTKMIRSDNCARVTYALATEALVLSLLLWPVGKWHEGNQLSLGKLQGVRSWGSWYYHPPPYMWPRRYHWCGACDHKVTENKLIVSQVEQKLIYSL